MLVSILPVPFADAARQRQYEAVLAALDAEADAPATVLLGNLGAFSPLAIDLLIVRSAGLALVVLTPRTGQLTLAALAHGPWHLDGQPLPDFAGADNPFVQYQQQVPVALTWLSEHLGLPVAELPPCAGMALFEAPLTFGPGVEAQLHHHAATDFHLVGGAGQLPARLRQPLAADVPALNEDELLDWGEYLANELANEPYAAHEQGVPVSQFDDLPAYLGQKLRQLWGWLGADDIPADPPYGGTAPPPDQHLRDQQEQARLHQLRQELLAELAQQRQEAAAREASRTQELAQLRQQLAQAGQPAAERQAEQQAQAALEESLRTARTELATRNQELDARLRQLEQLSEQLRATPATAMPVRTVNTPAPAPRQATPRVAPPKAVYRRLQQAERWGLLSLALAITGAGGWSVVRWLHPAKTRPLTTTQVRPAREDARDEEDQAPSPVIIYDSVAHVPQAPLVTADTTLVRGAAAPAAEHEAARQAESAPERLDSAASGTELPRSAPADSAAASPAP